MARVTADERSPYLEDRLREDNQPVAMAACIDGMVAYLDVEARQKGLRRLDYLSEYLQSDHWKATRRATLRRAGYRCQRCGFRCEPEQRYLLQVHHLTYERVGAELDEDLEVVCRPCHQAEHDT